MHGFQVMAKTNFVLSVFASRHFACVCMEGKTELGLWCRYGDDGGGVGRLHEGFWTLEEATMFANHFLKSMSSFPQFLQEVPVEARWGGKNDGERQGMDTRVLVGLINRFPPSDSLLKLDLARPKVLQDVSCRNTELPVEGTRKFLWPWFECSSCHETSFLQPAMSLLQHEIIQWRLALFFFFFFLFSFEKQLGRLMEVFTLIACLGRLQGRFSPKDLIPFYFLFFPTHWPPHGGFQSMNQSKVPLRRFSP